MKRQLAFIVLIIMNTALFAQAQNSVIKAQAMDMARALLKKDYTTFAQFMHPDVLKMVGGKEKMVERMDTMNLMSKQFGAEIKKVTIGNPGPVLQYKNELQATLPQTTEMQTSFGSVVLETTLIAISADEGKHWYFIDTSVYNVQDVKKNLPNLSPELVIPPMTKPRFTPKE